MSGINKNTVLTRMDSGKTFTVNDLYETLRATTNALVSFRKSFVPLAQRVIAFNESDPSSAVIISGLDAVLDQLKVIEKYLLSNLVDV